jgi:hypothetical protein
MGYGNEVKQQIDGYDSAWSYEDLPSNKAGAKFGHYYFQADGLTPWEETKNFFGAGIEPKKLSEMLEEYLEDLTPLRPEEAPNWDELPETDVSNGGSSEADIE